MADAPAEEPQGARSMPGFVKTRPENNDHYVEQMKEHLWYPIIARTHLDLSILIPGYNISQIKEKFGGLRFYFDYPDTIPVGTHRWNDTEEKIRAQVDRVIHYAEAWVDGYEARRRGESE